MPVPNSSTTTPLQALIVTGTFCARIQGVPVDAVRPVLEAVTPAPRQGGETGYELGFVSERHYELDPDGAIIVMAGLVPRVVAHLERLGYRVKVQHMTRWESLLNANHTMRESGNETAEDQRFLDALAVSPRGQVVVRNDAELVGLVAKLGSFFPTAHTLIVAANLERVDRLYGVLSKCCDRPVKRTLDGLWSIAVRTYICTRAAFCWCTAQDWTIVVFADPESALAALSQMNMATMIREAQNDMRGLLSYCFVPVNQRLGPREKLRLESICGAEIYRQPDSAGPPAAVTANLVRMPECPPLPRHATLDDKRALWQDAPRNAAIAQLATTIASGNLTAIKRCGLSNCLPADISELSVAILVESTAHGRALLTVLPDWQLGHEVPALSEPAAGRPHAPVNHRIISTLVYAQRNGVHADILIRADGAVDWPLAANAFPWQGDRAYVIDIIGEGGNGEARLQRRIRGYERRGWDVEGPLDVVLGKLHNRPAGKRKVASGRRNG